MTTADVLGGAGLDDWFVGAVDRMVRGATADLDPYLVSVGDAVVLDGTRTSCRCHFVARDGNDRPVVKALASGSQHRQSTIASPLRELQRPLTATRPSVQLTT